MEIGHQAFILTHVFVTDTAAVAGSAGSGHGRVAGEEMTREQTPTNTGRLADMAITTTGMAAGTMVAKHLFHAGMAISTGHTFLPKMEIGHQAFILTHVFVTDSHFRFMALLADGRFILARAAD